VRRHRQGAAHCHRRHRVARLHLRRGRRHHAGCRVRAHTQARQAALENPQQRYSSSMAATASRSTKTPWLRARAWPWSTICSLLAAPRPRPVACCKTWAGRLSWRALSWNWPDSTAGAAGQCADQSIDSLSLVRGSMRQPPSLRTQRGEGRHRGGRQGRGVSPRGFE